MITQTLMRKEGCDVSVAKLVERGTARPEPSSLRLGVPGPGAALGFRALPPAGRRPPREAEAGLSLVGVASGEGTAGVVQKGDADGDAFTHRLPLHFEGRCHVVECVSA
ncbi:predicted protein [Streptomyces viridosporus ATCC 14672]|uniref:Predicted protein n=1 Tax=Streptomyces viridosporus (strain ATCC 14672 / DSM 40746 / JCM 4963 / KCTC 9882 / NRRL B-12104 / FH 1290) TaxID=566461 RepID=D6AA40_STRV1|nr:predicted protein [Streptomyces viridosporus ATCC 14672]